MDEAAYKVTRNALNQTPCVFEKALLSRCMECECAARLALAERETVMCTSDTAQSQCAMFMELLRERSVFALKLPRPHELIRHALMMKLQCGGLLGLQQALGASRSDAHQLMQDARQRWGDFLDLPWQDIVHAVVAWQGRQRHHKPEDA
jgi:hypothetical protein